MTVHRTRPLPRAKLRGSYKLAPNLIKQTQRALYSFFQAGRYEGGHEGICYWAGREESDLTFLEAVIVPEAHHERFGVFVSAAGFGEAARRARGMGLGVLAQVHSHPGSDVRHSDGDDDLIVMPFENMLSVVAPHYGRTLRSIADCGVHQFQDHRWVHCDPESVAPTFGRIRPWHRWAARLRRTRQPK